MVCRLRLRLRLSPGKRLPLSLLPSLLTETEMPEGYHARVVFVEVTTVEVGKNQLPIKCLWLAATSQTANCCFQNMTQNSALVTNTPATIPFQ